MVSVLKPRQELIGGQYLQSPNGIYRMTMQEDGNLVVTQSGAPIWDSRTDSAKWGPGTKLRLEYNAKLYRKAGDVCWTSGIHTQIESMMVDYTYMQMQDDGNAVIYRDYGKWGAQVLTKPDPNPVYKCIYPVSEFAQGFVIENGDYRLQFQYDGNLVIYQISTGKPTWNSGSFGGNRLVLQADGNFVIYKDNTPVWHTGTNGLGYCYVSFSNYGRLAVQQPTALWSTKTGNLTNFVPPRVIPSQNTTVDWKTFDQNIFNFDFP